MPQRSIEHQRRRPPEFAAITVAQVAGFAVPGAVCEIEAVPA